jgi:hypothetical protein
MYSTGNLLFALRKENKKYHSEKCYKSGNFLKRPSVCVLPVNMRTNHQICLRHQFKDHLHLIHYYSLARSIVMHMCFFVSKFGALSVYQGFLCCLYSNIIGSFACNASTKGDIWWFRRHYHAYCMCVCLMSEARWFILVQYEIQSAALRYITNPYLYNSRRSSSLKWVHSFCVALNMCATERWCRCAFMVDVFATLSVCTHIFTCMYVHVRTVQCTSKPVGICDCCTWYMPKTHCSIRLPIDIQRLNDPLICYTNLRSLSYRDAPTKTTKSTFFLSENNRAQIGDDIDFLRHYYVLCICVYVCVCGGGGGGG